MVSDSVFCLHPLQLSPCTPSTVTLNTRNGVSEAVKEDDCKTPRLVEGKIPEGDLLLQVSFLFNSPICFTAGLHSRFSRGRYLVRSGSCPLFCPPEARFEILKWLRGSSHQTALNYEGSVNTFIIQSGEDMTETLLQFWK